MLGYTAVPYNISQSKLHALFPAIVTLAGDKPDAAAKHVHGLLEHLSVITSEEEPRLRVERDLPLNLLWQQESGPV